jgi:hypothetical protein
MAKLSVKMLCVTRALELTGENGEQFFVRLSND